MCLAVCLEPKTPRLINSPSSPAYSFLSSVSHWNEKPKYPYQPPCLQAVPDSQTPPDTRSIFLKSNRIVSFLSLNLWNIWSDRQRAFFLPSQEEVFSLRSPEHLGERYHPQPKPCLFGLEWRPRPLYPSSVKSVPSGFPTYSITVWQRLRRTPCLCCYSYQHQCAGKCLTVSRAGVGQSKEELIGSICQFPWCKYFHRGQFQAVNTMSWNVEKLGS